MQTPPNLFDREALKLRRKRAQGMGNKGGFLHIEAADQVAEKLLEVKKTFKDASIIGPRADLWAKTLALSPELPTFRVVEDKEIIEIEQSSLDLAIHGLALHWHNDPVGQLVQIRRALRPDGLMIAALFGGKTLNQLRKAFAEAESEIEGGISPRIAPMGEIRDLGSLIQRAGFALPVADSIEMTVTYESPLHLMQDLRAMGETNVMTDRRKTPLKRQTLLRTCEIYTQNFCGPDGRINASFEIMYLTGWAPSDTQQKPLRPGSAKHRLADALGVNEISLDD